MYKSLKLAQFLLPILVLSFCSCVHCNRRKGFRSKASNYSHNNITRIRKPDNIQNDSMNNITVEIIDADYLTVESCCNPSQILERIAYITSYNFSTRIPNWVAWNLTSEHTDGKYTRKGVPYYSDDGSVAGIGFITPMISKNSYFMDLESIEPRQELNDWSTDYNMSHGHMCPAADCRWDKAAMNQSFLLTNMCPQDVNLNGGAWARLEDKCRSWANRFGSIFIIAGPIFWGKPTRFLGHIAVPDAFFKVVLRIKPDVQAIGFIYPNDSGSYGWTEQACTVDEVEELSKIDFFCELPDSIETQIECQLNINSW